MRAGKSIVLGVVSLVFSCGLLLKIFQFSDAELANQQIQEPLLSDSSKTTILDRAVEVLPGQTLTEILSLEGLDPTQNHLIINAFKQKYDPKDLKVGQNFQLKIQQKGSQRRLLSLVTRPTLTQELRVTSDSSGIFNSVLLERKLNYRLERASGNITSSLYADTVKAGIPSQIISELTHGLSFGVHLQRDIHQNDPYEVIYESYYDPDTKTTKPGSLIYAAIGIKGEPHEIYRYQTRDGRVGLYNHKGESVKRSLLTTPVAAVRLSSAFGYRRHPIKGYSQYHKGVDFAASRGTPVMAAGDGIVAVARHWGGYGNYIRIKHDNGYATVYAHLSKYATGVHVGSIVRQGQVIGYVGSTGNSTGPHLHHEVLINGKHVNPQNVKAPPAARLAGLDMANFKKFVSKIKRETRGLRFNGQVALYISKVVGDQTSAS